MGRYIRALAKTKPPPITLDLFGEVTITKQDIRTWLRSIGLDPASPRAAQYAKSYNVIDKIRAAKIAGRWPPHPD